MADTIMIFTGPSRMVLKFLERQTHFKTYFLQFHGEKNIRRTVAWITRPLDTSVTCYLDSAGQITQWLVSLKPQAQAALSIHGFMAQASGNWSLSLGPEPCLLYFWTMDISKYPSVCPSRGLKDCCYIYQRDGWRCTAEWRWTCKPWVGWQWTDDHIYIMVDEQDEENNRMITADDHIGNGIGQNCAQNIITLVCFLKCFVLMLSSSRIEQSQFFNWWLHSLPFIMFLDGVSLIGGQLLVSNYIVWRLLHNFFYGLSMVDSVSWGVWNLPGMKRNHWSVQVPMPFPLLNIFSTPRPLHTRG